MTLSNEISKVLFSERLEFRAVWFSLEKCLLFFGKVRATTSELGEAVIRAMGPNSSLARIVWRDHRGLPWINYVNKCCHLLTIYSVPGVLRCLWHNIQPPSSSSGPFDSLLTWPSCFWTCVIAYSPCSHKHNLNFYRQKLNHVTS